MTNPQKSVKPENLTRALTIMAHVNGASDFGCSGGCLSVKGHSLNLWDEDDAEVISVLAANNDLVSAARGFEEMAETLFTMKGDWVRAAS